MVQLKPRVISDAQYKQCTVVAQGMLRANTPVEYHKEFGLYVKREDLACPPPGPPFSKTRGVYAHILARKEKIIGVLDTRHSQAGWAVARACQILGKQCINFYPEFKHEPGPREPQLQARKLEARLFGLPAGRSAILFHQAKKLTLSATMFGETCYMMPNALKLIESVTETAKEVPADLRPNDVIIPISSGTIAAGVIKGFSNIGYHPNYCIHLGYSRSVAEVYRYLQEATGINMSVLRVFVIDEEYAYKDTAIDGETPPWPCNEYYDLKAFRWYMMNRERFTGKTLFWNIG